ncbi:MAG: hypothetical protein Q7S68_03615, partial [Deltaproteobacteria bacterium]|nr:hypothetical protein [Deltaproteobacteria bacterium]
MASPFLTQFQVHLQQGRPWQAASLLRTAQPFTPGVEHAMGLVYEEVGRTTDGISAEFSLAQLIIGYGNAERRGDAIEGVRLLGEIADRLSAISMQRYRLGGDFEQVRTELARRLGVVPSGRSATPVSYALLLKVVEKAVVFDDQLLPLHISQAEGANLLVALQQAVTGNLDLFD